MFNILKKYVLTTGDYVVILVPQSFLASPGDSCFRLSEELSGEVSKVEI